MAPLCRRILEAAVLVTPLAYGTVHPLPVLIFEITGLGLFAACLAGVRDTPAEIRRLRDVFFLAGVAAVFLGLLQLVPLPWALLSLVAPGTARLLSAEPAAGMAVFTWHPASVVPWYTERGVVWVGALTAWYGAARLEVRTRADQAELLRALAAGGIVLAVLGIAQRMTGATRIAWVGLERKEFFATLVNPNNAAGMLTLATAACIALALRRRRASAGWLFGGLVTASATVLTLSRGGIGVLVFALVLTAAGLRKSGAGAGRSVLALTAGALAFVLWVGASEVVGELATIGQDGATLNGRTDIWRSATGMLPDFWLLGSGYGNFEAVFPAYFASPARVRVTAVENEYLQAWVEGGLLGGALAFAALAAATARIRRAFRKRGAPAMALAAGFAALLVHMLIDFPLHVGAPALWIGVSAALLAPRESVEAEPPLAPVKSLSKHA